MKKSLTICSISILIFSIASISAFAQEPTPKPTNANGTVTAVPDEEAKEMGSVVDALRAKPKSRITELEKKAKEGPESVKAAEKERDEAKSDLKRVTEERDQAVANYEYLKKKIGEANNDKDLVGKLEPGKKGSALPQVVEIKPGELVSKSK